MFSRFSLSEITRAVKHRRPIRLAIQTAVAGSVTFALGQAFGLEQLSWAVISALFVVQATIGGTLGTAIGRIAGAVLGALIGLAWIFAGGSETLLLTGVGILVAGAATAYVAGLKPTLRYGAVTSAIIIVNPGSDPLMQAWHYAVAIGLGGLVGSITSLSVFPWKARLGISEELGRAVRRSGDLLRACSSGIVGREADELGPIHRDIRRSLVDAQAATTPSRNERLRRAPDELDPESLIRAVERLWHAIIMIDRTDTGALPQGPRRELAPHLDAATESCCEYLVHLGEAIASGDRPEPPEVAHKQLEKLHRALGEIRQREQVVALSTVEAERVFTLAFAFDHLNRDIAELARMLGASSPSGRSAEDNALSRADAES